MANDLESDNSAVNSDIGNPYDEEYYHSHCGDRPYQKGNSEWEQFFGGIADEICRSLRPRTVFDAGCAIGFLVEALWDRGVEAAGRDISEYAISQVRSDVREYCNVGTLAEPIDGHYDLICCIEVLEHVDPITADRAIDNFTAATDRILFSSTPDDFEEPTHVNVRPPLYWIRRFVDRGFQPIVAYDATFLSPQAILFERSDSAFDDGLVAAAAQLIAARVKYGREARSRIELNLQLSQATEDLRKSTQQVQNLEAQLAEVQARVRRTDAERDVLQGLVIAAEKELLEMRSSVFWRLTEPAREISGALPEPIRRLARRSAVAIWKLWSSREAPS